MNLEDFTDLLLLSSWGLTITFLGSRKSSTFFRNFKLVFSIILFFVGVYFFNISTSNEVRFMAYSFSNPLFFLLADRLFTLLSYKFHGRDLFLHLKGFNNENSNIQSYLQISDIVFSIFLFILPFIHLTLGALLFGKSALFDKWFS